MYFSKYHNTDLPPLQYWSGGKSEL